MSLRPAVEREELPAPRVTIAGRPLACSTLLGYAGAYQLTLSSTLPELAKRCRRRLPALAQRGLDDVVRADRTMASRLRVLEMRGEPAHCVRLDAQAAGRQHRARPSARSGSMGKASWTRSRSRSSR